MSIYYLLAKCCFDTAKNEPCKVCPLTAYRSLLLQIPQVWHGATKRRFYRSRAAGPSRAGAWPPSPRRRRRSTRPRGPRRCRRRRAARARCRPARRPSRARRRRTARCGERTLIDLFETCMFPNFAKVANFLQLLVGSRLYRSRFLRVKTK